METVGKLNNQDANILSGGDEKFEKVVTGLWKIFVEVFHIAAGFAELCDAIYEESDIFAKLFFNIFESDLCIFDSIVKYAGDDGIFIHIPLLENLHNS